MHYVYQFWSFFMLKSVTFSQLVKAIFPTMYDNIVKDHFGVNPPIRNWNYWLR